MKRNLLIVFVSLLMIIYFYKERDYGIRSEFTSINKKQRTTPVQDAPISIKNSAIRKLTSKAIAESSQPESNLVSIHLDDNEFESYKSLQFPSGRLIERKILDQNSYVEIFKTNSGDTVTNIYHNGALTSERWESRTRKSIIRSTENGRIFAISEKGNGQSTTLFYDHSQQITKRIDARGNKQTCITYINGSPYSQSTGACKDDDFREYDDIRGYN